MSIIDALSILLPIAIVVGGVFSMLSVRRRLRKRRAKPRVKAAPRSEIISGGAWKETLLSPGDIQSDWLMNPRCTAILVPSGDKEKSLIAQQLSKKKVAVSHTFWGSREWIWRITSDVATWRVHANKVTLLTSQTDDMISLCLHCKSGEEVYLLVRKPKSTNKELLQAWTMRDENVLKHKINGHCELLDKDSEEVIGSGETSLEACLDAVRRVKAEQAKVAESQEPDND